jgi:hypothetical protein
MIILYNIIKEKGKEGKTLEVTRQATSQGLTRGGVAYSIYVL